MSPASCCAERLVETISLAGKLLDLATESDGDCRRNGCLVFYGVVRDSANKIRRAAAERKAQQRLGRE